MTNDHQTPRNEHGPTLQSSGRTPGNGNSDPELTLPHQQDQSRHLSDALEGVHGSHLKSVRALEDKGLLKN